MSSLVLIAPALATFASVAPPCYLGLLGSSLEAYDEFKAGYEHALPPWGGVLKGLGAACLFVGHFTLAAYKDRLARCDFCYLVGAACLNVLFGGACLAATGHMYEAPGMEFAMLAGVLLFLCFADMASAVTRATRYMVVGAICCGLGGSCSLVWVAMDPANRPTAAMTASCCFFAANATVLVALHRAATGSRVGQLLKVCGSLGLFSGNCVGLGYHKTGTAGGVLGTEVAAKLFAGDAATQGAVLLASAAASYALLAVATAPAPAPAPKAKKE